MNGNIKGGNEGLPEIVLQAIEEFMPYFEELHKKRIRLMNATEQQ